jgi:hypothetical protein
MNAAQVFTQMKQHIPEKVKQITYFYNYYAVKIGEYNQFHNGTITTDNNGDCPLLLILREAKKENPGATINIKALNII